MISTKVIFFIYLPLSLGFVMKQANNKNNNVFHPTLVITRLPSTSLSVLRDIPSDTSTKLIPNENNDPVRKLWSYIYNIQTSRRKFRVDPTNTSLKKPAIGLLAYLSNNSAHQDINEYNIMVSTTSVDKKNQPEEIMQQFVQVLSRAIIQGIRIAGECNDYNLVMNLVEASIKYANDCPILEPRIFGEALAALTVTTSNISKIKQIWKRIANYSDAKFLRAPIGAFELNTMLKALASRRKYRAAVKLYRTHVCANATDSSAKVTVIEPDDYTSSIVFLLLKDSIADNQEPVIEYEPPIMNHQNSSESTLQSSLLKWSKNDVHSPCWQWNDAVGLLSTMDDSKFNNQVYSNLLSLLDRYLQVFQNKVPRPPNTPRLAMSILDSIFQNGVVPDVITCTVAMRVMAYTHRKDGYKAALRLLNSMTQQEYGLPQPNVHTFTEAISACARGRKSILALNLLENMRNDTTQSPPPNTWSYNAAISSLALSNDFSVDPEIRLEEGLRLFEQMKHDHSHQGMDTSPTTVTYNTIIDLIAKLASSCNNTKKPMNDGILPTERMIDRIIEEMNRDGIAKDEITYSNLFQVLSNDSSKIMAMLDNAIDDLYDASSHSRRNKRVMLSIHLSALSCLTLNGDVSSAIKIVSRMQQHDLETNHEVSIYLIKAFVHTGQIDGIISFLDAIANQDDIEKFEQHNSILQNEYGVDLSVVKLTPLEGHHYQRVMNDCLADVDLKSAYKIISYMRQNGFPPSPKSMNNFALAFAKLATNSPGRKEIQQQDQQPFEPEHEQVEKKQTLAATAAKNAKDIVMALDDPHPYVLSNVAKACAAAGNWYDARSTLRALHRMAVSEANEDLPSWKGHAKNLPTLHHALLRQCASCGDLKAALWIVDDIQSLSKVLRALDKNRNNMTNEDVDGQSTILSKDSFLASSITPSIGSKKYSGNIGMKLKDWTQVIFAASKAGNWRICLSTLQFLRPYLEKSKRLSMKNEEQRLLYEKKYNQILPGLTAATRCFEKESQHAWAVRVINDWVDWSGRRPEAEAVLSTIRSLSVEGHGGEVLNLLERCVVYGRGQDKIKESGDELNFEERVYIGAITALYHNGCYVDADRVFSTATSNGHISFELDCTGKDVFLDLHGMNVALAHSAVRAALEQQQQQSNGKQAKPKNMIIVTGRGVNSAQYLRPVLRPEIQRMLMEEFYPPLNTMTLPGNMGALIVFGEDISAWQQYQRQQKGIQMMTIASMLKELSPASRLRKTLTQALINRRQTVVDTDKKKE